MRNPNTHLFSYCPKCGGNQTLDPASIKLFSCRICGFVFYLNCASACMALIFNENQELLVTYRKHDPGRGTLDLPGGFAEPGESIETALTREVKEELNLHLTRLTYLHSFPNTYEFRRVTYFITDMAFICEVDSFNGISANDDVQGFEFIRPKDLDLKRFGLTSPKLAVTYFLTNFK